MAEPWLPDGRKSLTDHRASTATNTQIDTQHPESQESELRSSDVNPADPFLVRSDELPDLTDEQWTALVEIGKAGGGVALDALSRGTLGNLLRMQVIEPAAPGRVEITGIGIRLLASAAERRQERA